MRPPVEVQILAFNDFHGNLEPPGLTIAAADGEVPAGGAAFLATALRQSRIANSITVSAGDVIGASPLISSLFLDEPTVDAMNAIGLDLNAVGNHEFDRGAAELQRMQAGGCQKYTSRIPCRVEPFGGARFRFLAANVFGADGRTIFPGTALRQVGGIGIGFIGMTLRETPTMVVPTGVAGLRFADEVTTANAAAAQLVAAGAQAVVLLIHQGGAIAGRFDDQSCPGLDGAIVAIVAALDPAIEVVVSGHTHNAYICHLPRPGGGERLLTSAGKYGTLVADIRLSFAGGRLAGEKAGFVIVQGAAIANAKQSVPINPAHPLFAADPAVAAIVARYHAASAKEGERVVGHLGGVAAMGPGESGAAAVVADSMWFFAKSDFALTNSGGARADLIPGPGGAVTFAQITALEPFANRLITTTMTGAAVKAVLEQAFASGTNSAERPNVLIPSANVHVDYDLSRPAGDRVTRVTVDGKPLDPARLYRVTVPNFLADGGDNFTLFRGGTDAVERGGDLEAMEAWLATSPPAPTLGRAVDTTP
ncbi:MAG: bifunctional metallophosphatase/5'-nucleotidase [Sphingomicrobium sp.]